MRLLLDTHVWLWALLDPSRLSQRAQRLLHDPANELWLSPVSVWEAHLLAERGRIELDAPPGDWIERELTRFPLRDAPLTRSIAIGSRAVRLPHADPADRFIAATAAVGDLDLVTADAQLASAGACRVVPAAPARGSRRGR